MTSQIESILLLVLDYENEIKRAWNTMVETTCGARGTLVFLCIVEICASQLMREQLL